MTYPAQQFGQQPGFAPPAQQYAPPTPQYQQGMGAAPGGFFQTQDPHQQAQQPMAPQFQQPPPMPQTPADTSGFWGGAAAISWDAAKGYVRGTPRGGQVLDKRIAPQTKLGTNEVLRWADGRVREQMVITLQTSERADPQDNGQRQLFVKGDMPRAVREAFQAVGAADVEKGGWLYAAWVDEKPAKQAGYNPQKIFKAVYAAPGQPDPMAGQPGYTPAPGMNVPVPPPTATTDHYAAYAHQQANGGPTAQPQMPQQFAAPAAQQAPAVPQDQAAQFAAWQAQQSVQPQQPGTQQGFPAPEQQAPPTPQGGAAPGAYNPFGTTG